MSADIANHRVQTAAHSGILELEPHGVQAVLVALEHHQRGRLELHDLTAQLGADRAAGAGDHDPAPANQVLHGGRIETDRRAGQQIFDREVPDFLHVDRAADDVGELREDLDRQLERIERADDGADRAWIRVRDRDQHLARMVLRDDLLEVVARTQHWHAVDTPSDLGLVVVHEPDRLVAAIAVDLHVADDQLAGVPGPEHQDAPPLTAAGGLAVDPARETQSTEHQHEQQRVADEDRAWIDGRAERALGHGGKDHGAGEDCADDRAKVIDAGVPPQPVVQAKRHERQPPDHQQPRQHLGARGRRPVRRRAVEP